MVSSSIDAIREIRKNSADPHKFQYSEADTIRRFIDPILDFLQYTPTHQRREEQLKRNRPDIVLWDNPYQMASGDPAKLIIEAKPLGTDLNGNGKAKQERPKEQLARYVTGYERRGPGTLGILTDGNIWHVVSAIPNSHNVRFLMEVRLLEGSLETATSALEELQRLILDGKETSQAKEPFTKNAREFTNAIADEVEPVHLLSMLVDVQDVSTDLEQTITLEGNAKRVERAHWDSYAFAPAGKVKAEQPNIFGNSLCVAVVRMKRATDENDRSIYRPDVATVATTFAKTTSVRMSVVVVIQPDEMGNPANTRLAVHYQGHTSMTVGFNPYAPPPHILNKIQVLYKSLRSSKPVLASKFADIVAAKGTKKEYYKDITEKWVLRHYRQVNDEELDKKRQHRQAILRHLMRTLFVWILKEEGKLPQEAFDPVFANHYAAGNYHQKVLTYLFHERLNIPLDKREPHPVNEIDEVLKSARFLNGSLFARHRYDESLSISDEEYFGDDPENPGLFTILSNYEWTSTEHTATHSDQTIDPEILSNLFENLIVVMESSELTDRMPKGTYYTPADVAREMAKDALMLAVKPNAPPQWSENDLLMLFDDNEASMPAYNEDLGHRGDLIRRITNLTVFDPSVGSGVFLLNILSAIREALQKLGERDNNGKLTRRIISQQLFAQDINPMAVQITRLRLAIAIIAAEDESTLPLPNLEAKVVCANTLSTIPKRNWSLTATGGLQDQNLTIVAALSERANLLQSWQNAHEESVKLTIRRKDKKLRDQLKRAVQDSLAGEETIAFADFSLLDPDAPPVHTDPRLIFYRSDWQGFDIVIGNPPYEMIAKGQDEQKRKRVRDRLSARGYTTVPCNNLYALIAEAGLTLARPQGGVLSLIVPLSICFDNKKETVRKLIEENSSKILLRSHDNRPEPIFGKSPVINPESRQRSTILNAVMSLAGEKSEILVTGVNKWRSSERHLFLTHRSYTSRPENIRNSESRLDNQWERIPTHEMANLITEMRKCQYNLISIRGGTAKDKTVGFPKSAYEFLTVVPSDRLDRNEFHIQVGDQDDQAVVVAAANSHIAYTWWKTYDDAFHVNFGIMSNLPIPSAWVEDAGVRRSAIALGRNLIGEIRDSNITWIKSGKRSSKRQSLNFHACVPATIEEIDRLYLTTLGLSVEPLLKQMRSLRSNSTWQV